MDRAIGVFVFVGIVGGIDSMVTVAIAEIRGLIRNGAQSAGWFFFGLFVPVIAALVAALVPRRSDGTEAPTEGFPRTLTAPERAVLLALLRHEDFLGRDALLAQVDHISVEGSCSCGCASVHLTVRGVAAAPSSPSPLPTEAEVLDERGNRIGGIVVFAHDGYLSYVEVYAYGPAAIAAFPPSERVRFLRVPSRAAAVVG